MIVQRTPEQQKKLEDILAKIRQDFLPKLEKDDTVEKRTELLLAIQNAIDSFTAEEEAAAFKKLKGDRQAIIDNAKEQIGLVIEHAKRELVPDSPDANIDGLVTLGIVSKIDGKYLVNATYIIIALKDELKLHLNALQNDKSARTEINKAILDAIYQDKELCADDLKATALNPNLSIFDAKQPFLEPIRERRAPLPKLEKYRLSGDELGSYLLQSADFFEQELDGQMRLYFDVPHKLAGNTKKKSKLPAQVITSVALSFDPEGLEKSLRNMKRLRAYDRAVLDAVGSIGLYWKLEHPAENLKITPEEVWRIMNGKQGDNKAKPSPTALKKITQSIDKMSLIRLHMDITQELEAYDFSSLEDELKKGVYSGYLLPTESIKIETSKGQVLQAYEILKEPFIYRYNQAKKRLVPVEAHLLDTSQYISDTDYVTEFKHYLIMQIALMKRGDIKNRILLDSIYEKTGTPTPRDRIEADTKRIDDATGQPRRTFKTAASMEAVIRRTQQDDLKKIEGILTAWKDKEWIKGFTPLNKNRTPAKAKQNIIGYDIKL